MLLLVRITLLIISDCAGTKIALPNKGAENSPIILNVLIGAELSPGTEVTLTTPDSDIANPDPIFTPPLTVALAVGKI